MAELLALPTVAASPIASILSGMIDAAGPEQAADPFAACFATAQAAPPVKSVSIVMSDLVMPVIDNGQPAMAATPQDAEAPTDASGDQTDGDNVAALVDPALSPALALLTALVAPRMDVTTVVKGGETTIPVITNTSPRPQPLPQASGAKPGVEAMPGPQAASVEIAEGSEGLRAAVEAERVPAAKAAPTRSKIEIVGETPADAEAAAVADAGAPVTTRSARPANAPAPVTGEQKPEDTTRQPASPRVASAEPAPSPVRRAAAREMPSADPIIAVPPAPAPDVTAADLSAPAPATDLLVQRQLVIADDGRWLDSLAHDIAQSASGDTIRFRLEPVNLGSLTVAIAHSGDGAAIRLTAETHRARDLLVEAQPALVAEAQANGLRISETHVDLGNSQRDSSGGNAPAGNQASLSNGATGQQAMRQDGNPRRQPDVPPAFSNQPRPAATRAPARDSGERFA